MNNRAERDQELINILLTLLAWIGTYLPWVTTTGAAFSSNLYDLAEWTSLYPAVRGGNPPLLPTFLLRATPALIAIGLSLHSTRRVTSTVSDSLPVKRVGAFEVSRWMWGVRVLAVLIAVGLLPPFDFFRGQFGDPNYRQQFIIAGLTLLIIIGGWWRAPPGIGFAVVVLAVLCALAGAALGLNVLGQLGLHAAPGVGVFLTPTALILSMIISVMSHLRKSL